MDVFDLDRALVSDYERFVRSFTVKYLGDGHDGYDCCAWIVGQPWCNGKIGTMGLSYAAHTQAALGCANAMKPSALANRCASACR